MAMPWRDRANLRPRQERLNTSFRNPLVDRVWTYSRSSGMVKPRELEELRHISDSSADECIEALHVRPGTYVLKVLDNYVSRPSAAQPSAAPGRFMDEITAVPDWVEEHLVRQGQNVFWKYLTPIVIILGNCSLVGGFAASRVTDILSCTNYFSKDSYQRLVETSKFLLDIMEDPEALQPVKGVGWKSITRVRMLHTQVRLNILAQAVKHPTIYDVEELGIPINQEDLLGTLCEFSIAVISSLRKMGFHLSPGEVKAYLHLWRFIGYYMGIGDEYCRYLITESGASAIFDSISNHLFDPDEGSAHMARTLLESMALRVPLFWPLPLHVAITRALLGDKLSDGLRMEPSNWFWRILAQCVLLFLRWIHSSTIFLQQRVSRTRKYVPRLYEAFVATRRFEDSHLAPQTVISL